MNKLLTKCLTAVLVLNVCYGCTDLNADAKSPNPSPAAASDSSSPAAAPSAASDFEELKKGLSSVRLKLDEVKKILGKDELLIEPVAANIGYLDGAFKDFQDKIEKGGSHQKVQQLSGQIGDEIKKCKEIVDLLKSAKNQDVRDKLQGYKETSTGNINEDVKTFLSKRFTQLGNIVNKIEEVIEGEEQNQQIKKISDVVLKQGKNLEYNQNLTWLLIVISLITLLMLFCTIKGKNLMTSFKITKDASDGNNRNQENESTIEQKLTQKIDEKFDSLRKGLKDSLQDIRDELSKLNNEGNNFRVESQRDVNSSSEQLSEADIQKMAKIVESVIQTTKINWSDEILKSLQSQTKELAAKAVEESKKQSLSQQPNQLRDNELTYQTDVEQIRIDVEEIREMLAPIIEYVKEQNTEVHSDEDNIKIQELQNQLTNLQKQNIRLEDEKREIESEREAKGKEISDVQLQLNAKEQEAASSKQKIEYLEAQKEELETRLNEEREKKRSQLQKTEPETRSLTYKSSEHQGDNLDPKLTQLIQDYNQNLQSFLTKASLSLIAAVDDINDIAQPGALQVRNNGLFNVVSVQGLNDCYLFPKSQAIDEHEHTATAKLFKCNGYVKYKTTKFKLKKPAKVVQASGKQDEWKLASDLDKGELEFIGK